MLVIGLDGKEYKFNPKNKERGNASELHEKCRELLKKIIPRHKILEEVPLPGCGKTKLFADFFIPSIDMMIEVHGRQHFKYTQHFFKSKAKFMKAKARDDMKREWCELNEIELVELNYDEREEEWESKIRG